MKTNSPLLLFAKLCLRDNYIKNALGVNGIYILGIIVMVIIPRLL